MVKVLRPDASGDGLMHSERSVPKNRLVINENDEAACSVGWDVLLGGGSKAYKITVHAIHASSGSTDKFLSVSVC